MMLLDFISEAHVLDPVGPKSNYLNRTSHFLLYIIVAYLFPEYCNKIFFH